MNYTKVIEEFELKGYENTRGYIDKYGVKTTILESKNDSIKIIHKLGKVLSITKEVR